MDAPKRLPINRPDCGTQGRHVHLLSNYFRVALSSRETIFYQYSVSIKWVGKEERAVEGRWIKRKILEKLYKNHCSQLDRNVFAYDGENFLHTVDPLPRNNLDLVVDLEESHSRDTAGGRNQVNCSPDGGERKRSRHTRGVSSFKVELCYVTKIPIKSIENALKGIESAETQNALRVFNIIIRQQHANRGCLLVRQSFFNDFNGNQVNVGGGVSAIRGFHSSFRATQSGLALNMDVSTTVVLTPGPVLSFLLENQKVQDPREIDWTKAKRVLKNMRVVTKYSERVFKIFGLSELPCEQQLFTLKTRNGDEESETVDISVYEYFLKKNIELTWSASVPCLDVGRPKKPNYLPIELCDLISLQRYKKSLSRPQRTTLLENSRQRPLERIKAITDAFKANKYDEEPMLAACGISIEKQFFQIDGRVLNPPMLKLGGDVDFLPRDGRWNFRNKTFWSPVSIKRWAIVSFSTRCDLSYLSYLSRELIDCGRKKGIMIERPHTLIEEDPQCRRAESVTRVEEMFKLVQSKLPGYPDFLLCVLPERKNSDLYGPWKKKNLHEMGIVTQCMAPPKRIDDQFLTNLLLKINAKLGGINSILSVERTLEISLVNRIPTLILGMDVSHGSPGRADIPSIASVVGSRCWPSISKYSASVRSQSPKVEMIDNLYKLLPNGEDDGIMREILIGFYVTSSKRKPAHVIIFRDGVSESQFSQVLNVELEQVIQAFETLGIEEMPKFTVIVAQKNHHTKLFLADSLENVLPGTVVDTKIVHPTRYDFFMCAHAGLLGTSRPTHYHVLLDEIGFSVDDMQNLVHSLSYVYQRSTAATSIVAPIAYAHHAAQQMCQFVKFEDLSNKSEDGFTASDPSPVPEIPALHEDVRTSMFFC